MGRDTMPKILKLIGDGLAGIGRNNGKLPFRSQDPVDAKLYDIYIGKTGEGFFKAQRTHTLEGLLTSDPALAERVIHITESAKKLDQGQEASLVNGQYFCLDLKITKPARRFKQEKLGPYLRTKMGWSAQQVDALIEACTEKSDPIKTFTSVPIRTE